MLSYKFLPEKKDVSYCEYDPQPSKYDPKFTNLHFGRLDDYRESRRMKEGEGNSCFKHRLVASECTEFYF